MEERPTLIDKLNQATERMRELQAEMMVMQEYIIRYMERRKEDKELPMVFSFEGEESTYKIEPQQLLDLLEPYKIGD